MQLGMIGVGRMGGNMTLRLLGAGHECVAFALKTDKVEPLQAAGATITTTLADFVAKLRAPRAVWLMIPAAAVDGVIRDLTPLLARGDVLIDGGNSHYVDDIRRASELEKLGLHYLDVGTSGGVWGRENGYCQMVGGEPDVVARLAPIFSALAPGGETPASAERPATRAANTASKAHASTAPQGWLHCGPHGAGHFVKMVHNGIEYGLMAAFAEGFDILKNADIDSRPVSVDAETAPRMHHDLDYRINVADVAEVWRRGSVVGSWLLDLAARALAESPELAEFSGRVSDSGEGRWTIMAAIEEAVPCEVLTSALYSRFRSRQDHTFADKICSAMRFQFGGHLERSAGE